MLTTRYHGTRAHALVAKGFSTSDDWHNQKRLAPHARFKYSCSCGVTPDAQDHLKYPISVPKFMLEVNATTP
jgi:hypothetical protein